MIRDCRQEYFTATYKENVTEEVYQRNLDGEYQRHQRFRTEARGGYDERQYEMETLCDNLIDNQWLTEERERRRRRKDCWTTTYVNILTVAYRL